MLNSLKADLQRIYPQNRPLNFLRAALLNPSFQAAMLIRLTLNSGRLGYAVFRILLICKHGIDVGRGAKIGSGIYLPHPMNIVIGKGVNIAENVTIYHGVTLGKTKGCYPSIQRDCVIFPNSVIVGHSEIAEGTKLPPLSRVLNGEYT